MKCIVKDCQNHSGQYSQSYLNGPDQLYEEVKHHQDKPFLYNGKVYDFIGILVNDEDYYYGFYSKENG